MSNEQQQQTKELEAREPEGLKASAIFEKYRGMIAAALPKFVNGDNLLKTAIVAVSKTPLLLKCHPATVVGGFIQSAQLGLHLDGVTGEAYLVPFWNESKKRYDAQFMVGYKGLRKLIANTDRVSTFLPAVVYAGDDWQYNMSRAEIIEHKHTDKTDYSKPVAFYTVVKYKDGTVENMVMDTREVETVRAKFSKTYQSAEKSGKKNSTWHLHFEAMACKTVMRRHAKYLPLSAEAGRAVALDELADVGMPQDLGLGIDADETPTVEAEVLEDDGAAGKEEPKALEEKTPDSQEAIVKISEVKPIEFKKKAGGNGKRFEIIADDKVIYKTFSEGLAKRASELSADEKQVRITFRTGQYGNDIITIEEAGS